MAGKGNSGHRATTKARPQQPRSAEQPRSARGRQARPDRPEPGRERAAGSGRGGPSAGPAAGSQSSVRDMIRRLDGRRGDGARSESPTKRPRQDSVNRSVSSDSSDANSALDQPLTELTLRSVMQSMTQQIRSDIASEFAALRDELSKMSSRVWELEKHVEQRDNFIEEIENRLKNREDRVEELEEELERISCDNKKRDLIFAGSAIPAPPAQSWTEDVTSTTVTMLNRCLPDVKVDRDDIDECFRIARGRRILCRFRRAGKGSVRDRLYENRFAARRGGDAAAVSSPRDGSPPQSFTGDTSPTMDRPVPGGADTGSVAASATATATTTAAPTGSGRDATTQQLYVSENLTRRKQEIFQALLAEKRAQRLYTVFTKNGDVFCKIMKFGQKVRVDSMSKIEYILRQ